MDASNTERSKSDDLIENEQRSCLGDCTSGHLCWRFWALLRQFTAIIWRHIANGLQYTEQIDPHSQCNISPNKRAFIEHSLHGVSYKVPSYYRDLQYIGSGAFGNVVKAVRDDGIEVAIKKLYEPLRDGRMARRVLRELRLLKLLQHENTVQLIELFSPDDSYTNLNQVYTVTVFAGWSLTDVLKRQITTGEQFIQCEHQKFVIYQILRGLKYIHSAQVIHRDLKPSNIAITEHCDVTILDFGLARSTGTIMTEYVMTRWYRAPEVLYWNIGVYNAKADMWSVGCILAEMILGTALFPGEDVLMQYRLISQLCGSPDRTLLEKIERLASVATRQTIESLGPVPRGDFAEKFPGADPWAVDLLDKILVLDPDTRLSVTEALEHKYLDKYRMPEDEPESRVTFQIEEKDIANDDMISWKSASFCFLGQLDAVR